MPYKNDVKNVFFFTRTRTSKKWDLIFFVSPISFSFIANKFWLTVRLKVLYKP